MKMKKFVDIEVARINDDEFKLNNVGAFEPGDIIQISEKIDGSNSSLCWDEEAHCLKSFSRTKELDYTNTLAGFWNFANTLPDHVKSWFRSNPNYVMFGEWNLCGNKIKDYREEYKKSWFVYDIYDKDSGAYQPQKFVREIVEELGLNYIHALYDGPFVSWDHVKTFLHQNTYGDTQEGVVVKNQSKIALTADDHFRLPIYLKIVNDSFKEKMNARVRREKSEDELAEEARVQAIVDSIVTRRRVEKAIEKLRDEGVLPEKLEPKDMALVAKNLPKYVYQDCVKEEKEMVESAGETFGKKCGGRTMELARMIILGN